LEDEAEKIELDGATAYVVDMEGTASAAGMGRVGALGLPRTPPARPQAAEADVPVKFNAPTGWQPGPATEFSKVSLIRTEGDQMVAITVSDLPAAAGDVLANVNRWRGQIGLPAQTRAELDKELSSIDVGGKPGQYVTLQGSGTEDKPQTILGVIVEHSGRAWFIKLIGDAPLAAREKQAFEAFVKSLRLGAKEGTSDGN
jgi:hypothetical protein